MNTDLPPPDEVIEKLMKHAHDISTDNPCEVCPVCGSPLVVRHGHTVCDSDLCKNRVVEGCCGQ